MEQPKERPEQIGLAAERYNRAELEEFATWLIDNREAVQHDNWQDEPRLNAYTSLFEELTASGHLSRVEFNEDVDDTNRRTIQRLLNGWSTEYPEWEQRRRFHEIVEELIVQLTWQDIQQGVLLSDTMIITLSDCPEAATDTNGLGVRIGYRTLNRKGMVRVTSFEHIADKGWRRVIEQVSRSNSNDGSSSAFFSANTGVAVTGSEGALSSQIIASKSVFPDGVIDVQRALDGFAGNNYRFGDAPNSQKTQQHPEYHELRRISAEREEQLSRYVDKLAAYEVLLNEKFHGGEMSYQQKLNLYRTYQQKLVDEICLLSPDYAVDARGELSAKYFEQAAVLMAQGRDYEAQLKLEQGRNSADPRAAGVCGGIGEGEKQNLGISESTKDIYENAQESRKSWKWKDGTCVVKTCPTRPGTTKVGPCNVCKLCQGVFDKGKDPTKIKIR